jgi:hypothetical protein
VPKVPKSKKSTLVKELNGREYEGCEVKKHFDGFGTFEGMVISTRRDPLCWLVRYADGDEEVAKHAQPWVHWYSRGPWPSSPSRLALPLCQEVDLLELQSILVAQSWGDAIKSQMGKKAMQPYKRASLGLKMAKKAIPGAVPKPRPQ